MRRGDSRQLDRRRGDQIEDRSEQPPRQATDPEQHIRREQSGFLAERNHGGEVFDFDSLRHTCGAWLAMSGAHPEIAIEFVVLEGEFGPALIDELSKKWKIPKNFMFIGSPGSHIMYGLAELGGVPLII